ncbi:DNA alkylation repair protein [Bacteroidota bacterium]
MNNIDDISSSLRKLGTAERSAKSAYYAPTSMDVFGISNPLLKTYIKTMIPVLKQHSRQEVMDLCTDLVHLKVLECQVLSWMVLEKLGMVRGLTKNEAQQLEGVLDNWVSVDTYGVLVYGVLWRVGTITDDQVYALQDKENVWYRRLALVATVALNLKSRGGFGDTERTLVVCTRAVSDHHDMIVKALSWALRSLIRWDPETVNSFLLAQKSMLHSRVFREVNHKLKFGTKN